MGCEKMSKFLLQTDAMEIEEKIAKEQLDRTKLVHSYRECTLSDLDSVKEKDFNPIGTIQFVEKYLGITETPIEIPKYLQTEEFLKREYKIVKGKDLPRRGRYFVKNASKLKDFSVNADMEYFLYDEMIDYKPKSEFDNTLCIKSTDNFVVSEDVKILSEYRLYVFNNVIVAISHYNGNPLLFPDTKLLEKVVMLISYHEKYLKSYTIDVMITKKGTSLIEIHNFTSVGFYTTLFGTDLLYAYKDGIDYLRKDNSVKYL